MHKALSLSIPVASLLFCVCIGAVPGLAPGARTTEEAERVPPVRQPIVGGTSFPDLRHYEDPITRSEVWSVSPPHSAEDETIPPPPPIYVSPEINLPWPGVSPRPQPRQPTEGRP